MRPNFRCIYQLRIWLCSHIPIMPPMDPIEFGWTMNKEIFEPVLTTCDPIPADIRKLMQIFCKDKICQSSKCVCLKERLKCCSDCPCKNCQNTAPGLYEDDEDEII